ncbi:MAG: hypothetical protein Q8L66_00650 [Caulobacter sp.]|nr:hypothetical protein [Caulobacter sp.]
MHRSIDWVLRHSSSIWCGVIRARIARGDGPENEVKLFTCGAQAFAQVRFPTAADLVLAVDLSPDPVAAQ